jgi:hypothetical protein
MVCRAARRSGSRREGGVTTGLAGGRYARRWAAAQVKGCGNIPGSAQRPLRETTFFFFVFSAIVLERQREERGKDYEKSDLSPTPDLLIPSTWAAKRV